MKVVAGADNNGFLLKNEIVAHLRSMGLDVEDIGTSGAQRVPVDRYALEAATAVSRGDCDFAVLVCGTGQGMAIFANKVKGVRAALCNDVLMARLARRNNDANVLCIGADIVGTGMALAIADEWIEVEYGGGEDDVLSRLREIEGNRRGPAGAGDNEKGESHVD